MSANHANRRVQRRAPRRAKTANQPKRRGNGSSIAKAMKIGPSSTVVFTRRTADLTLYTNAANAFTAALPPGFSGPPFLVFGTPFADTPLPGIAPYCIGFALNLVIDSLSQSNDILNMFTEYQIRGITLTFQTLMGDSYNATTASLLPEVLSALDPTTGTPPTSVPVVEAYSRTKRSTVSNARKYTFRVVPRPAVQLFGSALLTTYAYLDNTKDVWMLSNNSTSAPYYGCVGVIRNFPLVAGNGNAMRVSGQVTLAARRPH